MPLAAALLVLGGMSLGCDRDRCGSRSAEFRVALAALPTTLDWNRGHTTSWGNYPVLQAMMRGLVTVDAHNAVVPDLAEGWEVRTLPGPEGKPEYTFHLREVVWSDGVTPLTARDFVVGLRRALLGAQASELSDVDGVAGVLAAVKNGNLSRAEELSRSVAIQAVDDRTLRVRLVGPRAYFLARIAGLYTWYPAPSRALEGMSPEEVARYFDEPGAGNPLVLGAYRVASWDRLAQVIRLERNPSYRGSAPVERLALVTSPLAEFLYDRGQIAFLLFDDPAALSRPPPDLQRQELLSTYWLGINAKTVPLLLRQAIAHAVDRPRLLQGLLPRSRPAFGFLPDDLPGAVRDGDVRAARFPRYDPGLARALVDRAGYKGRELTLLVRGTQTFLPERGIADALRRQLAEVGIRVRYELSRDFVQDLVNEEDGSIRSDLFLRRIGADYAHPETFFSIFEPGGNHFTALDRADAAAYGALQAVLQRAAAELDPERSRTLYADAQEAILERSAVVVPLLYPDRYFRRAPGVEGLRVDPFNFLTFRDLRVAGAPR
jgi:peptide/nickel transport system substrate-binding protein